MKTNFLIKNSFSLFSQVHIRTIILFIKNMRIEIVITYLLFFFISVFFFIFFKKSDLHLYLNQYHCRFFDVFFKYATYLGDGIMFGAFIIIFFFIKRKMSFVFILGGVLTLLLTHFFKKIIYMGVARPIGFFGEDKLHLIEGVEMAFLNSFPSGHTMTAFTIFVILCIYFRKCVSQYLWVLLAIIAGVSRVYLSQHFWIDIFAGSLFGILIAFISMGVFFPEKRRVH